MTRVAYDTIGQHAADIPAAADNPEALIAGYVDGRYAWTGAEFARFPRAAHVRITVFGVPDWRAASVIDVEAGAFTPQDARSFLIARRAYRPGGETVYCSLSTLPQVRRACRGLPPYNVWLAWYRPDAPTVEQVAGAVAQFGCADLAPSVVAVQWRPGGMWDESVVYDADWHPAP
jgi:hypothetical protein